MIKTKKEMNKSINQTKIVQNKDSKEVMDNHINKFYDYINEKLLKMMEDSNQSMFRMTLSTKCFNAIVGTKANVISSDSVDKHLVSIVRKMFKQSDWKFNINSNNILTVHK